MATGFDRGRGDGVVEGGALMEPGPSFEPPSPTTNTMFARLLFGAGLLGVGLVWLGELADWWNVSWAVVFPSLLIALGLALVVLSPSGAYPALIWLGVPLLIVSMLATVARGAFNTGAGIGDRSETPTLESLEAEYELGMGDLLVDLTGVAFPEGTTQLRVTVGIGKLAVEMPAGVTAEVKAEADLGSVKVFGSEDSGVQPSLKQTRERGSRRVVLEAEVGIGEVVVR